VQGAGASQRTTYNYNLLHAERFIIHILYIEFIHISLSHSFIKSKLHAALASTRARRRGNRGGGA
jgi:hypothetical protein